MKCRSGGATIGADDAPDLVASLQVKSVPYRLFKQDQPSVLFHSGLGPKSRAGHAADLL
jgi:hypothetical protein